MSNKHGGKRIGSGRKRLSPESKKYGYTIYFDIETRNQIIKYGNGKNFSTKVLNMIENQIDLFTEGNYEKKN